MPAVTGLSVVNSHEAEALRGRGIASRLPVARIERLPDTFHCPLSLTDLQQRSNENPHHVLQKARAGN